MQSYLEGLIANEDVAIQGETEFSSLEEGSVCFWMLAVYMQWQELESANKAEDHFRDSNSCFPHVPWP